MSTDTTENTDGTTDEEADDGGDEPLAIYSDFVCPFCYLGRASLRRYREERADRDLADLDVEWRFFDLRGHKRGPDGEIRDDVEDGKGEDYYDRVRENVVRLREEYDAEMLGFDDVADADSRDAQQVALYVKRSHDAETFRDLYDAVLDAYWVEGRDIGDEEVIVELAEGVGVDADEVRDAIGDERLDEELERQFEEARRRGVTGVPTFVSDGHAARGAVPPEHLRRLLEGV
ncbi:disulfide bond formation protein DsbA [Halobacteriales archaeon QS_6_71_20]|nr:MAG: disulfide bond formation protein DsbA [Halobacteriales archaeon QS_6_71_20]